MFHKLLDILEDPFEMFPVQSFGTVLGRLADELEDSRFERAGWYGVSEKYYTVEDEHDIEVVQILVGTAFVLGQAAVTQAVSILAKIHESTGKPSWIPHGRRKIMDTVAPVHRKTGLSKITIINAVANYFKHRYEWDDNWSGPARSQETIEIVVKLGMRPTSQQNTEIALRELGMLPGKVGSLAQIVVEWRESLAAHIREQLDKHGF
jgi:hypothetical protein